MIYRAADGTLPSIAVTLTDFAPPDAFHRVAAGRAAFRVVDLLALCTLLEQIEKRLGGGDAERELRRMCKRNYAGPRPKFLH